MFTTSALKEYKYSPDILGYWRQECVLEDGPEKENGAEDAPPAKSSSKNKKSSANGPEKEDPNAMLVFRVSHKVPYKTVLEGKIFVFPMATQMGGPLLDPNRIS